MDDQWTNPNPAPADPAGQPAQDPVQPDPNAGGDAPAWTPPAEEPAQPAQPTEPAAPAEPAEPAWTPQAETPAQETPAPQPGGSWDQGNGGQGDQGAAQ